MRSSVGVLEMHHKPPARAGPVAQHRRDFERRADRAPLDAVLGLDPEAHPTVNRPKPTRRPAFLFPLGVPFLRFFRRLSGRLRLGVLQKRPHRSQRHRLPQRRFDRVDEDVRVRGCADPDLDQLREHGSGAVDVFFLQFRRRLLNLGERRAAPAFGFRRDLRLFLVGDD